MKAEERSLINQQLANVRDMSTKRLATQTVMAETPELERSCRKIRDCSFKRPCNDPNCNHCADGYPHRASPPDQYVYKQKADPKQARGKSKNYRSMGSKWLLKPFQGIPDQQCHPFTLDMFIEERSFDAKASTKRERAKFQSIIQNEMPEAIVRITLDISVFMADQSYQDWSVGSITPRFQHQPPPTEIAMNFHGHGILWHPFLNRNQIGAILRKHYIGPSRLCFSNPVDVEKNTDGYLSGGLEGWGEYAAMEKTEVKFPDHDRNNDNYAAVKSMLLVRDTWPRSSRKISYGDKPNRVKQIQQLIQEAEALNIPLSDVDPTTWL